VLDELGEHRLAERALAGAMSHPLTHAEPGLLHGSAGIGMACLRLANTTGDPKFRDRALGWAVKCGQRLADTAIRDDRGAHWARLPQPAPLGGEPHPQPVGYATGASGIALFLLYLSAATGDASWQALGRAGLDYDLSWAFELDAGFVEFPSVTHDPAEEPKVVRSYWDEGTAGVATTLLRYRATADDADLAAAWQRMRPDLCRKYVVLPQLFHGLAGIGMALMDAAELLGDDSARREAHRLAAGLAMYAVPRENGVAWPSEQCFRESADLATGAAGAALFLHRLSSKPADRGRTSNGNLLLDELL
jgi:lantibiotic modifying enzyme